MLLLVMISFYLVCALAGSNAAHNGGRRYLRSSNSSSNSSQAILTTTAEPNRMEKIGWPLLLRIFLVATACIVLLIAGMLYLRKKNSEPTEVYRNAQSSGGLVLDLSKIGEEEDVLPCPSSPIAMPAPEVMTYQPDLGGQETSGKINTRTGNRPKRKNKPTGTANDTDKGNRTNRRPKRKKDVNFATEAEKAWYNEEGGSMPAAVDESW